MLRFVIRKMLSKKWMILALLIGNILLISISAGNPMYTHAVFQRTLNRNLETYLTAKNAYPGLVSLKLRNQTQLSADILEREEAALGMPEAFGVDSLYSMRHLYTSKYNGDLLMPRDDADDLRLSVAQLTALDEHAQTVAGRMYHTEPDEQGIIDAVVSEKAMIDLNLLLDDVIIFDMRVLTNQGEISNIIKREEFVGKKALARYGTVRISFGHDASNRQTEAFLRAATKLPRFPG